MEIMITNPDGVKLKTANKYCSEDINVYPILQEKTATINNTDITIDQGYAGLSVVHVAVPESGRTELNIAYGDTPPTDTSKLWIKSTKPANIEFSRNPEQQVQGLTVLDKYLPTEAGYIAAAAVGTKVYLFGGTASNYLNTILEFDTDSKTIKNLAEEDPTIKLPTAAGGIAAAAVGTKIYLFGGYNSDISGVTERLNTILEFDTDSKTIKNLAEEDPTIKLPTAAGGIAAAAVGTKVYLFGGYGWDGSKGDYLDTILEFDTSEKTITTLSATLPTTAYGIETAAVGTKIYLFGGRVTISSDSRLNTILEFDTSEKTITTLSATLPTSASVIAAAAVGTKIYLFGGSARSGYLNTIYEFNTETKTRSTLSVKLPTAAGDIAAAAVGTKVYLFGGNTSSGRYLQNTIQEFIANFPLITNDILAQQDYNNNIFIIVPAPTKVTIGVKNVYKGNSSNFAEFVDAYLYNGTNWVNINTGKRFTQ